ncbi:response regulator [Methylibium rhizosphaerae]|uniref:response regulator n=1 Tax=Methylibium rhizosphaerae TaxID=2570323 RepID=UPI001FE34681|nr:response regulator [Methylibium rhizosphaerae]
MDCLLELSRMNLRHPPPTVLMLTAFSRDEAARRLAEARINAAAMLTKPVTPSTLLDACLGALHLPGQHARRSERRDEALARQRASLAGARILLVEDNPINQELAGDLLGRAGILLRTAQNGQEALEWLEREPFDLVLMDCQMPVMDGYAATQALRQQPQWRDLPVIAMTANAMVGDREKVLAAGMNDHISKPVNVEELFSTLARWVPPGTPSNRGATAALPGLDIRAGLASVRGDEALYRRLLAKFRQREADFEARLRDARARDDGEAAIRCAHDLKSVAGTLGMPALQRSAEALEAALVAAYERGGGEAAIEPLLENVTRQLEPLVRPPPEHTDV